MRKNRIWLLAIAVMLIGSSMVMALAWTPLSAILTGSGPTVITPVLNGPYWLQPIPSSVYAGTSTFASISIGNPYPPLVNIWLIMNFTGAGVSAGCVTAGNCVSGSATVPGVGPVSFTFCSTCSPTYRPSGNPQFVMMALVPTLQSGISVVSFNLVFQHAGAYNEQVYFALNAPYP
jgi:hypothetical protein